MVRLWISFQPSPVSPGTNSAASPSKATISDCRPCHDSVAHSTATAANTARMVLACTPAGGSAARSAAIAAWPPGRRTAREPK